MKKKVIGFLVLLVIGFLTYKGYEVCFGKQKLGDAKDSSLVVVPVKTDSLKLDSVKVESVDSAIVKK